MGKKRITLDMKIKRLMKPPKKWVQTLPIVAGAQSIREPKPKRGSKKVY